MSHCDVDTYIFDVFEHMSYDNPRENSTDKKGK